MDRNKKRHKKEKVKRPFPQRSHQPKNLYSYKVLAVMRVLMKILGVQIHLQSMKKLQVILFLIILC